MNEETAILNASNDQIVQDAQPVTSSVIDWGLKLYGCPRYADEINNELSNEGVASLRHP